MKIPKKRIHVRNNEKRDDDFWYSSSEIMTHRQVSITILRAPHYVHLSINAATTSPSSGRMLVDPLTLCANDTTPLTAASLSGAQRRRNCFHNINTSDNLARLCFPCRYARGLALILRIVSDYNGRLSLSARSFVPLYHLRCTFVGAVGSYTLYNRLCPKHFNV